MICYYFIRMKFGKIKALKKIPRIHFIISLILIFFVWFFLGLSNKELPSLEDFIGFSSVLIGFYLLIIVIPWVYIPRPIVLKVWLTIVSIFLALMLGRFLHTFARISTVRPLEIFGLSFGILTLCLITLMPIILTVLLIIFDKTNVKSNYIPLFIYPFLIFLTLNHILIASSTPFMQSLLVAVREKKYIYENLEFEKLSKDITIKNLELELQKSKTTINQLKLELESHRDVCGSGEYVRTFSVEISEEYIVEESRNTLNIVKKGSSPYMAATETFIYISEVPCECIDSEGGDIYNYNRTDYERLDSYEVGVIPYKHDNKGDYTRENDINIDGVDVKVFKNENLYEGPVGVVEIRYQFNKNGVRYIAGAYVYPSGKKNEISLSEAQEIIATIKIN